MGTGVGEAAVAGGAKAAGEAAAVGAAEVGAGSMAAGVTAGEMGIAALPALLSNRNQVKKRSASAHGLLRDRGEARFH